MPQLGRKGHKRITAWHFFHRRPIIRYHGNGDQPGSTRVGNWRVATRGGLHHLRWTCGCRWGQCHNRLQPWISRKVGKFFSHCAHMAQYSCNEFYCWCAVIQMWLYSIKLCSYQLITVRCRYNAVNCLTNIHIRRPIARPLGRGIRCLCGFSIWLIFSLSSCNYLCNTLLF